MNNKNKPTTSFLHTFVPLEDFKSILGIDDREDKLACFCLVTSTCTIEQYCKRRLLRKKYSEFLPLNVDTIFYLREYPVGDIVSVSAIFHSDQTQILEPDFYRCEPAGTILENLPCIVVVSPAVLRLRGLAGLRAIYYAGYAPNNVPPDLASACLELAGWNFNRYRSRRIGLTGIVRGTGKDGEHLEPAMPENVRLLLEPYKRRVI